MRGGLLVLVLPLLAPLSSPGLTSAACTVDAQCSDTNPCTVDRCESGACVHLPNDAVCDDGNVCTDDLCDTSLGCLHANNGGGCNDAVACTTQDTCVAGTCIGGAPAAGCTPCQAAAAIPAQGGTFLGRTSGTGTLAGSCGTSSPAPERVYAWTPAISGHGDHQHLRQRYALRLGPLRAERDLRRGRGRLQRRHGGLHHRRAERPPRLAHHRHRDRRADLLHRGRRLRRVPPGPMRSPSCRRASAGTASARAASSATGRTAAPVPTGSARRPAPASCRRAVSRTWCPASPT